MDERTELLRKFYAVYSPLREKYHLRMTMKDCNSGSSIEIWKYSGEERKRHILHISEKTEEDCLKNASTGLKSFGKEISLDQ